MVTALFVKVRTRVYYRTSAASYGFQGGGKKFAYALFFMTGSAVDYLSKNGGWASGIGIEGSKITRIEPRA